MVGHLLSMCADVWGARFSSQYYEKVGGGEDVVLGVQRHFGRKEDVLANGSCS